MPEKETTCRLNLVECLVFMAIGVVIGSIITYLVQRPSLPRSNWEYAEIDYGMSKGQIRNMLGQPDDIDIVLTGTRVKGFDEADSSTQRDLWNYGPFGAYEHAAAPTTAPALHSTSPNTGSRSCSSATKSWNGQSRRRWTNNRVIPEGSGGQ